MQQNTNEDEEKFSDDPQENLRIENELLRLKMKAQFGDGMSMHGENTLPPEIENAFLNHVINFENNHQKGEFITLGEKIGITNPISSEGMSAAEVTAALENLEAVLEKHHIYLDRIYGPYPNNLIYDFIVNELLQKQVDKEIPHMQLQIKNEEGNDENEISPLSEDEIDQRKIIEGLDDAELPEDLRLSLEEFFRESWEQEQVTPAFKFNSGTHYIYEEFHPNHEKDIEKNTHQFLQHWEERSFNEYCTEMSFTLVTLEGKPLKQELLYKKMYQFFDSFTAFKNFKFIIGEIAFSEQEDGSLMGHSEGAVKYDAILENGEQMHFCGPFKLYLLYQNDCWQIMHFVMEGFSWDGL